MRISVDTADGLVDSLIEFNVFDTPAEKVELLSLIHISEPTRPY